MAQMPNDQATLPVVNEQIPQQNDELADQAEAIKLITEKMDSSFDEQSARKLFSLYALDSSTQRLQPPDVRKLLLDVLLAASWPLVVPDESLSIVLNELCLSEEGSISWIEFKSFFVFLQDHPLRKLLALSTESLSKEQIAVSRIVSIRPVAVPVAVPVAAVKAQGDDGAVDGDGDGDGDADGVGADDEVEAKAVEAESASTRYYDRSRWAAAVQQLIPSSTQILVYFMDGTEVLAMALGPFESALAEPAAAELKVDGTAYLATIRAFNASADMFPPMARCGGLKSKVARRIADSYLLTREWDQKHLKLVERASVAAAKVSVKWTEFDEKYKVKETMNATTASIVASAKAFDERHQLTRRLSNSAKTLDEKLGISLKVGAAAAKVAANERVQSVGKKVEQSLKAAVRTIDDIGTETQQLVQEKRQQNMHSADPQTDHPLDADADADADHHGHLHPEPEGDAVHNEPSNGDAVGPI